MNIAKPILDTVELEYHEEVWQQTLDYEHIPFRCIGCHEHGHLFKECPLNIEEGENMNKQQRKDQEDKEGFQEVKSKRSQIRANSSGGKKNRKLSRAEKISLMCYKEEKKKIIRSK